MQQELRIATFNVLNLAPPGMTFYAEIPPYTPEQYDRKTTWLAQMLDRIDADVIGFQEIFAQTCLRDVLQKTGKYRNARQLGIDPDPALPLSPSVALVTRLPVVGDAIFHSALPARLLADLPASSDILTRFTRPVLQAGVMLADGLTAQVFVTHMKSKRPDWRDDDDRNDPYLFGLATLRSLNRRGIEALGLRCLVNDVMADGDGPVIVMGDFNDVIDAVTSEIVCGDRGAGEEDRHTLYDCQAIQSSRSRLHDLRYTHANDGKFDTIDHVLVSRHFIGGGDGAIGEVREVTYLNDHVGWVEDEASDHGVVVVRIGVDDSQKI